MIGRCRLTLIFQLTEPMQSRVVWALQCCRLLV